MNGHEVSPVDSYSRTVQISAEMGNQYIIYLNLKATKQYIHIFSCSILFCQNLADIVAKQQKLKYYTQLKNGRYTPLCKTPETLEAELQKQRARLQSLMTIVDRLNQEFPQAQPALRKITLSLGYRGIPEEAAA